MTDSDKMQGEAMEYFIARLEGRVGSYIKLPWRITLSVSAFFAFLLIAVWLLNSPNDGSWIGSALIVLSTVYRWSASIMAPIFIAALLYASIKGMFVTDEEL